MYTLSVPYTDYKGKAKRETVYFNLDAREVFKNLPQLKSVFDWLESNKNAEARELSVQEVSDFYNDLEDLLLKGWGEMSEDGEHFRKSGKYDFEESALFNACMVLFVTKPEEAVKLLEGMLPPELQTMIKNADDATVEAAVRSRVDEKQAEIDRLKQELSARENQASTFPTQ